MFDRVAGVDDVEALVGKARVFDPRAHAFGAFDVRTRRGDAFVRFDAGETGARRFGEKRFGKRSAVGADIEHAQVLLQIGAGAQDRETRLGAESFAVADIAPIRAG